MELQQWKELADKLDVKYHHMAGIDKIEEAIKAYCEETGKDFNHLIESYKKEIKIMNSETKKSITFVDLAKKAVKEQKGRLEKDALKLVRCQISCNNPNKKSYQGEIFAARNSLVPEVKKFVPFNVPTHVPQILLNVIKEKQLQLFKKEKNAKGVMMTKPYLVAEYNIQELPPLTKEEFEAIKQRQLADNRSNE